MTRKQIGIVVSVAAVAAAGLGVGVTAAVTGTGSPPRTTASSSAPAGPGYPYYRSMMGRYFGGGSMMGPGSMMGGRTWRWMMGASGYRWMMGGAWAPGWMRGGRLPAAMMGGQTDPGRFMGRLWADAPGPRVTPATAAGLGTQVPAGAQVNRAARTITFTTTSVHLTAVASPAGGPDETFRIAGLVNPAITVPAGAQVSIQVVNADPDTAHGLVVTASGAESSWVPMMTSRPAFAGSALWFLGNTTSAGMHAGTLAFTASAPGTYRYLCPVPGHAQKGMTGLFTVSRAR
jgi:rusticyanin